MTSLTRAWHMLSAFWLSLAGTFIAACLAQTFGRMSGAGDLAGWIFAALVVNSLAMGGVLAALAAIEYEQGKR